MESWNHEVFHEVTGLDMQFVQDSHSRSTKNVLRDLHYQIQQPQGKLVHVVLSDSADFLYKTTDYYAPSMNIVFSGTIQPSTLIGILRVNRNCQLKMKEGCYFNKPKCSMRIMLTGANGQVGWELARSLMSLGEVIALNREQCDL